MAAIILFRINIEGTGYLSPDSEAYLGLAQNIKDGHGLYVLKGEGTSRHYFSTWPVGYPVLIYLFSEISNLDVYWASKILNLLLLATSFLLLRHLNRTYSYILASIYGAYTFMEVYSFTWSEAAFLLGILVFAHLSYQVWLGGSTNKSIALIFMCCLMLFLLRYIGAFSFAVPLLLGLYFGYTRKYKVAAKLICITILLAILAGGYLYINYTMNGFITGFNRLEAETESLGEFILMLSKGLLNEFLIIREFRPANQPDYLLYATASLQLLVLAYISIQVRKHYKFWQELLKNSFSVICLSIAFLYLVAILILRSISHFDDLDYRLLSPFSLLTLIGLIYTFVCLPDKHKEIARAKYIVFGFFVVSLLVNVPKKFVMSQLQLLF